MPVVLRTWRTPLFVLLGAFGATLVSAVVVLLAERFIGEGLALRPSVWSDRAYVVDAPSAATMSGVIALVAGCLLCMTVRPCKPRFLLRSAAGQGGACAVGLVALLGAPVSTELTFVALALTCAFIPALCLSGLAKGRLAEYRRIPRRPA